MATTGVIKHRFTAWPTALACGFPLTLIMLWSGPFDLAFVGARLLFMAWACSALLALGIAIFSLSARDWWRAGSMSVLPLATLAVIANAGTVWPLAMQIGEQIHFQAMRRKLSGGCLKAPVAGRTAFRGVVVGRICGPARRGLRRERRNGLAGAIVSLEEAGCR